MITIYFDCNVYPVAVPCLMEGSLTEFYKAEGIVEEKQLLMSKIPANEDTTTSDLLAEIAGRLCYMSYNNPRPGKNKGYLHHILEADHGSVLEHASISFILTGVSRTLTHELVRHRAGMAYSQLSQRFVDESEMSIVVPPERLPYFVPMYNTLKESLLQLDIDSQKWEFKERNSHCWTIDLSPTILLRHLREVRITFSGPHAELHNAEFEWLRSNVEAFVRYKNDVDAYTKAWKGTSKDKAGNATELRKAIRQMARSILPNDTETKILVTGNVRAWRHIMQKRGSLPADAEIRRLSLRLFEALKAYATNAFQDLDVSEIDDKQHIQPIN